MDSACSHLHPFADGELPPSAASAFRDHLAGCPRCQRELIDVLALSGLMQGLREPLHDRARECLSGAIGVVGLVRAIALDLASTGVFLAGVVVAEVGEAVMGWARTIGSGA